MEQHRASLALDAGISGVSDEDGVLSVGFAEDPDLKGWQFVLSRSVGSDDGSGLAAGDDGYDITSGWQEATVSGGVLSWATDGLRIELSIDDDAARELGLAKHVELTILDTSTNMDALVAALATVLGADVPRVTFGNPD